MMIGSTINVPQHVYHRTYEPARVSRPLTYPRRGLHGEVVHTIGMQIVTGTPEPATPSARGRAHRGSLGQPHGRPRGRPRSRRQGARRGEAEDRDARPGRGRTGTSSTRTSSAWSEAAHDQRLYEETTEIRLAIEPLAARLAATRATPEQVAGIAEAYAGMEAGVDNQPAYLEADLQFHGRILLSCDNELLEHLGRVPRAVLRATFTLTTTPSGSRRRRAPAPSCDPRGDPGARRGRRRDRRANPDR